MIDPINGPLPNLDLSPSNPGTSSSSIPSFAQCSSSSRPLSQHKNSHLTELNKHADLKEEEDFNQDIELTEHLESLFSFSVRTINDPAHPLQEGGTISYRSAERYKRDEIVFGPVEEDSIGRHHKTGNHKNKEYENGELIRISSLPFIILAHEMIYALREVGRTGTGNFGRKPTETPRFHNLEEERTISSYLFSLFEIEKGEGMRSFEPNQEEHTLLTENALRAVFRCQIRYDHESAPSTLRIQEDCLGIILGKDREK